MSSSLAADGAAVPSSVVTAPPVSVNTRAVIGAGLLILAGAGVIGATVSARQAALYVVGALMGLVLYHAAFGFTSAWRVFIADGRGAGLRAQMVMLAVASALFFPVLASGSLFGQSVSGNVSPVSVSVAVGAFLFGIGMQLGGGCASGTLYTVGGGSTRMIITLAAFVVGSTVGAAHLPWWTAQPGFAPVSLVKLWGPWGALAASMAVFALIVAVSVWVERRRHGRLLEERAVPREGLARFLRGPWPVMAGALALALLNFATLALAGRPWGVTSAFALWGSKIAAGFGMADVAGWAYWSAPARQAELHASVLTDVTSVMDFGIVLGAMLAAALAGRFAPVWRVPARSAFAAVLGGILLGYGARLAYGCNIGAYFSGIASGSLHGWLWLAAAFAGNVLGTRIRPLFGLEVERTPHLTGC